MDKKPSFLWALGIGALFTLLQVVIYFLRFDQLNPYAPAADYLFFFIGGSLIGLALIYFLRRSESKSAYRGTIIGFVIAIPFAVFGMLLGKLAGPLGTIFLSISPGILITAVGYFLGRTFAKE